MKRLLAIIGLFLALDLRAAPPFTSYTTNFWFQDGTFWLQNIGRGFINTNDTFSAIYAQGMARFHAFGPGQTLWQVNGSELLLGGGAIIEPDATNNALLINYPFGSGFAGNAVPFQIQTNSVTGLYVDTNMNLTVLGGVIAGNFKSTGPLTAAGVTNTSVTSAPILGTDGNGKVIASGSTIQTNGVTLATKISSFNFTNFTVPPSLSGATVTIDGTSSGGGSTFIREVLVGGSGGSIALAANTVQYAPLTSVSIPFGTGGFTTSQPQALQGIANGGYLSNFNVQVFGSNPFSATTNITFTILTNRVSSSGGVVSGINTPLTCVLLGGQDRWTNDATHSATFLPQGVAAEISVTNNAGLSALNYTWWVEWWHQ